MSSSKKLTCVRAALLTGVAGIAASGANAQTADGGSVSDNDIIVTAPNYVSDGSGTATKSNISLLETPQSISVVSRDQIDLLNFIDAQQAVRYVAGVSGENYGPDLRFDFVTVRGFVPRQFVDGLAAPVSTTIRSIGLDLYAFESLDILKGPASVLYGSAPPGGIYNQTSRRATNDEFKGEILGQVGTDKYFQAAGSINVPLDENVAGRITALYRNREAERDFVDAVRVLVAPSFNVSLGPNTEIDLLGYYQYDKVNGDTNGFLPVLGTLQENPLGEVPRSANLGEPDFNVYNRQQFGLGFDFSHGFSEALNFDLNFKYSEYGEDREVIFGTGLEDDNRTVTRGNSPYLEDVKTLAADARLSGKLDFGGAESNFLLGVDYRDVDNNSGFGFTGASSIDLFDPVYNAGGDVSPGVTTRFNEQIVKQTGIYAQNQLKLGPLAILLSGRYDWVDSEYVQAFTPFGSDAPVTNQKQDDFTYRVGASYITDFGLAPYISYATSFEPTLGGGLDGEPFEPTTGKQLEAGVKFDARSLGDGVDLLGSIAVYDIDQKNVVATQSSLATPVFGTQVGEVEVRGIEFELVTRINDALSLNGSFSYTDSEVKESGTAVEVGRELPITPRYKASFLVDYTHQDGALRGLGYNAGVRYTSESEGSLPGPFNPVVFTNDDSILVDASIRYDTVDWRFSINASNLFDKKYVGRAASPSNVNYGAGRQVIGTIRRKF